MNLDTTKSLEDILNQSITESLKDKVKALREDQSNAPSDIACYLKGKADGIEYALKQLSRIVYEFHGVTAKQIPFYYQKEFSDIEEAAEAVQDFIADHESPNVHYNRIK